MKRVYLNLAVDAAAAVLFLGMLATGFLLRFPLPPGSQKTHILWGLTRHQWGTVHTWLSFLLVAVLLVHVALHWSWITGIVRHRLGRRPVPGPGERKGGARSGFVVLLVVAGLFALFAWASFAGTRIEEQPREREPKREGRHGQRGSVDPVQSPLRIQQEVRSRLSVAAVESGYDEYVRARHRNLCRDDRRQRGRRLGRLSPERSYSDLSHHSLDPHGGVVRRMVGAGQTEPLGQPSRGG